MRFDLTSAMVAELRAKVPMLSVLDLDGCRLFRHKGILHVSLPDDPKWLNTIHLNPCPSFRTVRDRLRWCEANFGPKGETWDVTGSVRHHRSNRGGYHVERLVTGITLRSEGDAMMYRMRWGG